MPMLDLLHISIADQCLYGFAAGELCLRLPVSTALNGPGEQQGSGCTPRGRHQVRARIGATECVIKKTIFFSLSQSRRMVS